MDAPGDGQDPRRTRRRRPAAPGGGGVGAGAEPPPAADAVEGPPLTDLFREAVQRLSLHVAEVRADLMLLAKARKDRLGFKARGAVFQIATLVVVGVFGLATLVIAAWFFMRGLAIALITLAVLPAWAGYLIVGAGVPLLLVAAMYLMKRLIERGQLAELRREYAELERLRAEALARRTAPPTPPEPAP